MEFRVGLDLVSGAPNSPKKVLFIYFRPQRSYYLFTWSVGHGVDLVCQTWHGVGLGTVGVIRLKWFWRRLNGSGL